MAAAGLALARLALLLVLRSGPLDSTLNRANRSWFAMYAFSRFFL